MSPHCTKKFSTDLTQKYIVYTMYKHCWIFRRRDAIYMISMGFFFFWLLIFTLCTFVLKSQLKCEF